MRSRQSSQEQVAEVARRRLELLSAELAQIRSDPAGPERTAARTTYDDPAGPVEAPWLEPVPGSASGPGERADVARPGPGRHAHRPLGPAAMASGWLHDRLPATLQGRMRLAPAHLLVVVLVLVVGVSATAWWVTRADGGSVALPAPSGATPSALVSVASPPAGSASATPAAGTAAATSPAPNATGSTASGAGVPSGQPTSAPTAGTVVVDVAGKVRHPGITTLPAGSRVADALQAAGGARRGVRLGVLNLARVVADGEQIVVGLPAPAGVAASVAGLPAPSGSPTGAAVPMVNINTATQTELELLPGVGPVTAQSILAFRTERGTFSSVDELLEVSGIGDATLAKIAPYVTL